MTDYYETVPASTVSREIDGHLYAHVAYTLDGRGIQPSPSPRMVRFDQRSYIREGIAYVWRGAMGAAIAQREHLPVGIIAVDRPDAP